MDAPSMVQRSGDTLIVRSVVSGNQLYLDQQSQSLIQNNNNNSHNNNNNNNNNTNTNTKPEDYSSRISINTVDNINDQFISGRGQFSGSDQTISTTPTDLTASTLPQCKIKRNYSCNSCTYFTQNPRHFLTHLKDVHGEKIIINACKHCLYASKHYQKLVRHMKMVHGSTDGLEEQALSRKRASQLARELKKRKNNFDDTHQQRYSQSQQTTKQQHQQQQQQQQHHNRVEQEKPKIHSQPPQHHQIQQQQQQQTVDQLIISQGLFPHQKQQQQQQQHQLQQQQIPLTVHQIRQQSPISPSPPTLPVQLQPSISTSPLPLVHHANFYGSSQSESPSPDFTNSKLLKCTICDFTTLYRIQLTEHERDEHNKTKFFRCEKCSYVTHIKARFSKHVKYHSMPMIKCVMCDFRTPYKWNLDRHMKNHGGAGLYKCSACNFTADIKQSLTVHEMNHHVPPVGHASGMSMARRKNKVGGTDIIEEYSPMNLPDSVRSLCSADYSIVSNNNNLSFDSFNDEPILKKIKLEIPSGLSSPSPPQLSKDNINLPIKKPSRPVPNLIPIQGNPIGTTTSTGAAAAAATGLASVSGNNTAAANVSAFMAAAMSSAMNLSKSSRADIFKMAMEMTAASSPSSSSKDPITDLTITNKNLQQQSNALKDFASLFAAGDTEFVKQATQQAIRTISPSQLSPTSNTSSSVSVATRRKINSGGNFFEKLIAGNREESNLVCHCGHTSKCLSELIIHQKTCPHRRQAESVSPVNLSIGGSTRCQYCRHRCKSSADLFVHMQHCRGGTDIRCASTNGDSIETNSNDGSNGKFDISEDYIDEIGDEDDAMDDGGEGDNDDDDDDDDDSENEQPHPMENVTFVWNSKPQKYDENNEGKNNNRLINEGIGGGGGSGVGGGGSNIGGDGISDDTSSTNATVDLMKHNAMMERSDESENNEEFNNKSNDDVSYYGVETAPGYGEVTKKILSNCGTSGVGDDEVASSATLKKVFKCPHCSFWASTASRFHVHIVGHLNKKPFECSLCSYRSNWRWDITKHIRLKTIRDPSHRNARVLMNDETGRRNYTKYNKHITLMKVTEEDGDPKLLKSGEMTPSQEAALSFFSRNSTEKEFSPSRCSTRMSSGSISGSGGAGGGGGGGGGGVDGIGGSDGPGYTADSELPLSLVKNTIRHESDTNTKIPYDITESQSPPSSATSSSVQPDGGEAKKTSFKCKKCNFRDPNRDVVLTHVKGHYEEAGLSLDKKSSNNHMTIPSTSNKVSINNNNNNNNNSSNNNNNNNNNNNSSLEQTRQQPAEELISQKVDYPNALLRIPLTMPSTTSPPIIPKMISSTIPQILLFPPPLPIQQQQQQQQHELSPPQVMATDMSINSPPRPPPQTQSPVSHSINNPLSPTTIMATSNPAASTSSSSMWLYSTPQKTSTTIENGEMDEASSLGTSVTGWRDPAPYRCGHCHQVSNWKHVIQRHCRLKHNGDINIELIEKGSKKRIYNRLILPNNATNSIGGSLCGATNLPTQSSTTSSGQFLSGDMTNQINSENIDIVTNQLSTVRGASTSASTSTSASASASGSSSSTTTTSTTTTTTAKTSPILSGSISYTYQCNLCPVVADTSNAFIDHLQTHRDNPPTNNENSSSEDYETINVVKSLDSTSATILSSPTQLQQQPITESTIIVSSEPKQNQLIQLLNQKPKRYQCDQCSFTCPCKSQLESHISVIHQQQNHHEQINKSILNTNDKSPIEICDLTNDDSSAIDLRTPVLLNISSGGGGVGGGSKKTDNSKCEQLLMFCRYCPARFTDEKELTNHCKMHASWYQYRCSVCTFTSKQQSTIDRHMNVHSAIYQDKTNEMINHLNWIIHSAYPRPNLRAKIIDKDLELWIVTGFQRRTTISSTSSNLATTTNIINPTNSVVVSIGSSSLSSSSSSSSSLINNNNNNNNNNKELDLDDLISASKVPNKIYNQNNSNNNTNNNNNKTNALTQDVVVVVAAAAAVANVAAASAISDNNDDIGDNSDINSSIDDLKTMRYATTNINSNKNEEQRQLPPPPPPPPAAPTTIEKQILKIHEFRGKLSSSSSASSSSSTLQSPPPPPPLTNLIDGGNNNENNRKEEKCPHCPFSTIKTDILKDHMQCHVCVSGNENLVNCDHCDYSVADERVLKEHVRLHFTATISLTNINNYMENSTKSKNNRKNVQFFTSYDNLILTTSVTQNNNKDSLASGCNSGAGGCNTTESTTTKIIYPILATNNSLNNESGNDESSSSDNMSENFSDKENKILVDINTGEVIQ